MVVEDESIRGQKMQQNLRTSLNLAGKTSRENSHQLVQYRHQSLSSQPIENVINDKRKFELRGDSVAFKVHEACLPEDNINLLSNSKSINAKSILFPEPGFERAKQFGSKSTRAQIHQYRKYKVMNQKCLQKEENLQLWQNAGSNPANRVFDHFAVTMKRKNKKELHAYRTIKSVDNASPETDRQVRQKFLSPRDNIDKYKRFPMTTKHQVFSSRNKYIKAINVRN